MVFERRKIGKNISNICKERGISIEKFANMLGISVVAAGRVFDGRVVFSNRILDKIANAFSLSCEEILDEKNYSVLFSERKNFSNSDNENKIFDLIDDYIYIQERSI